MSELVQDNLAVESGSRATSIFNARNLSFAILLVAILISGYLSYLKVANVDAQCVASGTFDCGTVLNSAYSELAGIPIAWLGLATNLLLVGLLVLENRIGILRDFGVALVFGVVLFATLFSVYLIYIQAAVIQAYCPWCLTHEALIFLLFGVSVYRLWKWMNRELA